MTRLLHRPHPEQRLLLAACTTSSPQPAHLPRAVPAARLASRPGIASEVLADLRAADDALYAGLAAARAKLLVPLHRSATPMPALLAEAQRVMRSRNVAFDALMDDDRTRREDAQAAAWVSDAVATMLAENVEHVRETLAAQPELLAPPAHPGPRLWLRRIALLLNEPKPLTFDYQGLLDHAATLTHRNLDRAGAQLADAFAEEVSAR